MHPAHLARDPPLDDDDASTIHAGSRRGDDESLATMSVAHPEGRVAPPDPVAVVMGNLRILPFDSVHFLLLPIEWSRQRRAQVSALIEANGGICVEMYDDFDIILRPWPPLGADRQDRPPFHPGPRLTLGVKLRAAQTVNLLTGHESLDRPWGRDPIQVGPSGQKRGVCDSVWLDKCLEEKRVLPFSCYTKVPLTQFVAEMIKGEGGSTSTGGSMTGGRAFEVRNRGGSVASSSSWSAGDGDGDGVVVAASTGRKERPTKTSSSTMTSARVTRGTDAYVILPAHIMSWYLTVTIIAAWTFRGEMPPPEEGMSADEEKEARSRLKILGWSGKLKDLKACPQADRVQSPNFDTIFRNYRLSIYRLLPDTPISWNTTKNEVKPDRAAYPILDDESSEPPFPGWTDRDSGETKLEPMPIEDEPAPAVMAGGGRPSGSAAGSRGVASDEPDTERPDGGGSGDIASDGAITPRPSPLPLPIQTGKRQRSSRPESPTPAHSSSSPATPIRTTGIGDRKRPRLASRLSPPPSSSDTSAATSAGSSSCLASASTVPSTSGATLSAPAPPTPETAMEIGDEETPMDAVDAARPELCSLGDVASINDVLAGQATSRAQGRAAVRGQARDRGTAQGAARGRGRGGWAVGGRGRGPGPGLSTALSRLLPSPRALPAEPEVSVTAVTAPAPASPPAIDSALTVGSHGGTASESRGNALSTAPNPGQSETITPAEDEYPDHLPDVRPSIDVDVVVERGDGESDHGPTGERVVGKPHSPLPDLASPAPASSASSALPFSPGSPVTHPSPSPVPVPVPVPYVPAPTPSSALDASDKRPRALSSALAPFDKGQDTNGSADGQTTPITTTSTATSTASPSLALPEDDLLPPAAGACPISTRPETAGSEQVPPFGSYEAWAARMRMSWRQ